MAGKGARQSSVEELKQETYSVARWVAELIQKKADEEGISKSAIANRILKKVLSVERESAETIVESKTEEDITVPGEKLPKVPPLPIPGTPTFETTFGPIMPALKSGTETPQKKKPAAKKRSASEKPSNDRESKRQGKHR